MRELSDFENVRNRDRQRLHLTERHMPGNEISQRQIKRQPTETVLDGDFPQTHDADYPLILRVGERGVRGSAEVRVSSNEPEQSVCVNQ